MKRIVDKILTIYAFILATNFTQVNNNNALSESSIKMFIF